MGEGYRLPPIDDTLSATDRAGDTRPGDPGRGGLPAPGKYPCGGGGPYPGSLSDSAGECLIPDPA